MTQPFTQSLVSGFLDEMLRPPAGASAPPEPLLPDPFVHLGGDEADLSCFENDAAIAKVLA